MFSSYNTIPAFNNALLSALTSLDSNFHSQIPNLLQTAEVDFQRFKVKQVEDFETRSDSFNSQACSTSVSDSPLRQPNSPCIKQEVSIQDSGMPVFKLTRTNSNGSFLSYEDTVLSTQMSTNSNQSAQNKRKSNICLSRENIMKTWTGQDDSVLLKLADQYKNDWKKIAKRIITNNKKKVTPNFLKNRYKEVAGDQIKKGVKFTHHEDLLIAQLFQKYGTCWTQISTHFPDRTPVMIKNRYYSHIRRKGLLGDLVDEANDGSSEICNVKCEETDSIDESNDFSDNNNQPCEPVQEEIRKIEHEDVDCFLGDKERDVKFFDLTDPFFEIHSYFPEDELHTRITPYKNNFLFDY